MNDFKSNPFMLLLAAIVSVFVLAQSFYFLRKALKRAKELGMKKEDISQTIASSAVFSLMPAVSILLGLLTLSYSLGIALPWLRLSVLGAVTYELPAATAAASALGRTITEPIRDPLTFTTIAWVMTLGCIPPLVIIPLFLKKIQGGFKKIKKKDQKWSDLLMTALFMGMISAFLGMGVSGGLLSVLTLITSAILMALCGILIKKYQQKYLEHFALPISMLGSMAFAILYAHILPQSYLAANLFD